MEGQSELSYPTKHSFIILPLLLTLILPNLNANTANIPIPITANFAKLTYKAVPIFANTLTTFNNLKSANFKASEPAAALETNAAISIAFEEANMVAKVDATSKVLPTSFSIATATLEDRRKYVAGFAESHIDWGFKYRYGGNSVETGIDCSGFTRYVLNYFDIKTGRSADAQFEAGVKIPVTSAKAGDLVFFGYKKGISHVAMVVSNDEKGLIVVHSTTSRGIVKENITESDYWKNTLKSTAVNIIGM